MSLTKISGSPSNHFDDRGWGSLLSANRTHYQPGSVKWTNDNKHVSGSAICGKCVLRTAVANFIFIARARKVVTWKKEKRTNRFDYVHHVCGNALRKTEIKTRDLCASCAYVCNYIQLCNSPNKKTNKQKMWVITLLNFNNNFNLKLKKF